MSIIAILIVSCKPLYNVEYERPMLVDKRASISLKKLHKKLSLVAKEGTIIGHQDSPAYGIGWEYDPTTNKFESDVQKTAADFPGVYGFDLGHLELGKKNNLDTVPFAAMRKIIKEIYKKKGVVTFSWHLDNPVSNGNSWDVTPAVNRILYNIEFTEKYELWVKRLADFIKSLKYKGKEIPIILRPFHEMNGDWFWWGDVSSSPSDYVTLWKKTINLFKDKHQVHQILYAYSPNAVKDKESYLKYYPGDDYVDILGIDIYDHQDSENYIQAVQSNLSILKEIATEKQKLFGFTETGQEKITNEKWFTQILYPNIKESGISWILFWRNARKSHHYIPYPGHKSEPDFLQFSKFPEILFLNNIQPSKNQ